MGQKLTLDKVAEELGISRRSVRRLISCGELPAYRIGNTRALVRVDADDVGKLLNPITPNHKS